jgi:tetratricopeptide (TPR) repeat protein
VGDGESRKSFMIGSLAERFDGDMFLASCDKGPRDENQGNTYRFGCHAFVLANPGISRAVTCTSAEGKKAISLCTKLIKNNSTDPEQRRRALLLRAIAYVAIREPEKALADIEVLFAEQQVEPLVYQTRGDVYAALGQWDAAADDYRSEFSRNFYARFAMDKLAEILVRQGKFRLLEQDATRFLSNFPASPKGHFHRGWAYYKLGDFRSALADFDAALAIEGQLASDHAPQLMCRGQTLIALGELERAKKDIPLARQLAKASKKGYDQRCDAFLTVK